MSTYRSRVAAAALFVASAIVAVPGAADAAVVAPTGFGDGSFELPAVPAGSFTDYVAGQSIGPWDVTKGSVDLIGPRFWAAAEGDQSLDLNGYGAGAVSQTFATSPGTRYRVNYSLAGNPDAGPVVKTGRVLINGVDAQDFTFNITGKTRVDMGYSAETFEFTATLPQTTLTFDSTTLGSAAGPVIDAVTITAECCNTCATGLTGVQS
jgi:choice-of-anchor C domain-containing protein